LIELRRLPRIVAFARNRKLLTRIYPSNAQHIAIALRLTQDLGRNAKELQAALAIIPPDRRLVAKDYVVTEGIVPLFVLPDTKAKPIGKMKSDAVADVYLRASNWGPVERGRPDRLGTARAHERRGMSR
jgi:hypothetical protein